MFSVVLSPGWLPVAVRRRTDRQLICYHSIKIPPEYGFWKKACARKSAEIGLKAGLKALRTEKIAQGCFDLSKNRRFGHFCGFKLPFANHP